MKAKGSLARSIVAAGLLLGAGSGAAAERLALVIGNNDYVQIPRLQKAVGDAHAVKQALERLKFKVTVVENADRRRFGDALDAFEARISPGDEVVLHYSGHGISMAGRNYLLPTDIEEPQPGQDRRVQRSAYDASEIVETIRAKQPKYVFAVLDACRNNPFKGAGRSVALTRGLARMEAEPGAFILFSAGPGETALDRLSDDDPSPTSVFTRVLVEQLETPGLTLQTLAKTTQQKVRDLALSVDHRQFPDYSDRTLDELALVPGSVPSGVGNAPRSTGADTAFRLAVLDGSEDALKDVARRFPDHPRAKEVRELLAARADDAAFEKARVAGTIGAFQDYLKTPGARHADAAREALAALNPTRPQTSAQPEAGPTGRAAAIPPLQSLIGPRDQHIQAATFSPVDGMVAVAMENARRIMLWDTAGGSVRLFEEHPGEIYALAFSPDGRLLASTGQDKMVRLWEVSSGRVLRMLPGSEIPPRSIAFSPDGRFVAAPDQKLRIWNVATGEIDLTLAAGFSSLRSFAFAADGRTIVTAGTDRVMRFWDPATGDELNTVELGANSIEKLAFSPSGREVVTLDDSREIKIWDVEGGKLVRTLPDKGTSVAVSPDGRWLASGFRATMQLFDFATGKSSRTLQGVEGVFTANATFTRDGQMLMSSAHPASVWLLAVGSGRTVAKLLPLPDGEWAIVGDKGYVASPGAQAHLRVSVREGTFAADEAFRKRWLKENLPVLAVPNTTKP